MDAPEEGSLQTAAAEESHAAAKQEVSSEDEKVMDEREVFDAGAEATESVATLSSLSALGVQCMEAGKVEASIIGRCDAVLDLQQKRAELTLADKALAGLLSKKRGKRRRVSRDSTVNAAREIQAEEEADAEVDEEVVKARNKRNGLQAEVQQLEEQVAEQTAALQDKPATARLQRQKWQKSLKASPSSSSSGLALPAVVFDFGDGRDSEETPAKRGRGCREPRAANGLQEDSLPSDVQLPLSSQSAALTEGGSSSSTALPAQQTVTGAAPPEAEQASSSSGRRAPAWSIDVDQLVPKAAQDAQRWKEAYPSEWRALVGADQLSPHTNLLKRKPFQKSAVAKQAPVKLGKRRADDTNDAAFERRQAGQHPAFQQGAAALQAKQQVDADGMVVKSEGDGVKKELADDEQKDEVVDASAATELEDDVQVAEGLRSPRWLWEALYPYQHACIRWLWSLHRDRLGGILADEMGLGKTVQIVAFLAVLHHSGVLQNMRVQNTSLGVASPAQPGGVLVVCPATLISQWKQEFHLWFPPLRICVMHGVGDAERRQAIKVASEQQGVLITSYETLRIAHEQLLEAPWVMLVLDEGQKIRNPHAGVTMAVKRFSTPHRILLSGSPIQNRLQELWSLFDFICPGRLGTLPVFREEFAEPIEAGNLVGANEVKVATAYQCAVALRELTMPCILRRTKAEVDDVLRLPHKQEQVLFCHLTPEQYQVYIDFLQSDQVRKAMSVHQDRRALGAVFFAISVFRKLCNHPDLLLREVPAEEQPEDMWNPDRSGKMKVLAEIMKLWLNEKHRALIFVQTVQMLEVLERWMTSMEYTFMRIDGQTPVGKRQKLIEQFNADPSVFAMLLTTRVGGVGLNIIGANRVVIFDPDWNPMTDVQARERTWRIGQKRDVAVYRLVLTGSIEEKIYHRQIYKHFLSQKVLNDPRQRQFFKWNDLQDLFDVPPPPPNMDAQDVAALSMKYRSFFKKCGKFDRADSQVETMEVMHAISALPSKDENKMDRETSAEHNAILQTLYDAGGIKANFDHDKAEQPLLDRKIVRDGANSIAQKALSALKRSEKERLSHYISEPTWTGKQGSAGAVRKFAAKTEKKSPAKGFVRMASTESLDRGKVEASMQGAAAGSGSTSSADILQGLRQLAELKRKRSTSQADEAMACGLDRSNSSQDSFRDSFMADSQGSASSQPEAAAASLAIPELHASDRKIAELILRSFLDKAAGAGHTLTTGQVLSGLAHEVAPHHRDLFKSLLRQMCTLTKPDALGRPGYWTLREELWPVKVEK
mmetsp:Transcript_9094/g.20220  ORF Transcript_9094/g.20220 Transcript_9094/m.20220 type:complete len:1279 (-) Transcript_9094:62-3898(-)